MHILFSFSFSMITLKLLMAKKLFPRRRNVCVLDLEENMDRPDDHSSHSGDARGSARAALSRQLPAGFGAHALFAVVTMLYWSSMFIYVPVLSPYLEYRGLSMGLIPGRSSPAG